MTWIAGGGGEGVAPRLRGGSARVAQLSLRVESDPVMAANWLKQRLPAGRNIQMRLLGSDKLVLEPQLGPPAEMRTT